MTLLTNRTTENDRAAPALTIPSQVTEVFQGAFGEDVSDKLDKLKKKATTQELGPKEYVKELTDLLTSSLSASEVSLLDVSEPLMLDNENLPSLISGNASLSQVFSNEAAVRSDRESACPPGVSTAFGWAFLLLGVIASVFFAIMIGILALFLFKLFAIFLFLSHLFGIAMSEGVCAIFSWIRKKIKIFGKVTGTLVQKIEGAEADAEEEGTECSPEDYQTADKEGTSNNNPGIGAETAAKEEGSQKEESQAVPATTATSTGTDAENRQGSNVLA